MFDIFKKNKLNLIYIANSFSVDSGGRTISTFGRAELLKDYARQSAIMTLNYKVDYGTIFEEIKKKNSISDDILHLNLYEFYAGESLYSLDSDQASKKFNEADYNNCERIKKLLYRVTAQDGSFYNIHLNSKGEIYYINFFDEYSNRYKKESYDSRGKIRKANYYDVVSKKRVRTLSYTMEERLFLSIDYSVETDKATQCIVYDQKGNIQYQFKDEKDMNEFWINKIKDIYQDPIFFIEDRNVDYLVRDNRYNDSFRSIAIVHSSHLKHPYTYGSEVNEFNGKLLNNMSKYSAIVFLTNEQLKHVKLEFGVYEHLFKIAHFYDQKKLKQINKKSRNKIVVIARLVESKRIFDSLEAFRQVVKVLPEAKLELWGTGEEKNEYQKYIDNNGLNDNIFLKGYTDTPYDVFSQATASVITSQYEGFGLTILESLSSGTPVISYDFNYGPKELIINNKNGYIVENGNINELAQSMIQIFVDQTNTEKMSNNSLETVSDYQKDSIKDKWLELLTFVAKKERLDYNFQPQRILSSYMTFYKEDRSQDLITISLKIDNKLTNGTPNEKYYLYIKGPQNGKMVTKMYVEAELVDRNTQSEVISSTFSVNKDDYLAINQNNIEFVLGVVNRKRFNFYPIKRVE